MTLTHDLAQALMTKGYTWAVMAQYAGNGYERKDLISKHRTYEAASKAMRGNTFATLIDLKYVEAY